MNTGTFLLIFIVMPLIVDVVLLRIASSLADTKLFLSILFIMFIILNMVLPVLLTWKISSENFTNYYIPLVSFLFAFRFVDVICFKLGKRFLDIWRNIGEY